MALREETSVRLAALGPDWGALWSLMMIAGDLDGSFRRWLMAVFVITEPQFDDFVRMGMDYLNELDLPPGEAEPLNRERFIASMHALGVAAVKAAVARGERIEAAMAIGRSLTFGSFTRTLMDAQRSVIMDSAVKDPGTTGWRRVGHGGCDFCKMLISRGAVYSRSTASFASHDRCQCSAEPDNDTSPWARALT